MGHQHLGELPRTKQWREVVALVRSGAGVTQVVRGTVRAAEKSLTLAATDHGLVEVVLLLAQLPYAARTHDFVPYLRLCGMSLPNSPGLLEIVAAFDDAINAKFPNNRGRTDIAEMAQNAAVETLTTHVGAATRGLFGTSADEVRGAFADCGTPAGFGRFARAFFGRFFAKCLNSFLTRTLSDHTGGGQRFTTVRR